MAATGGTLLTQGVQAAVVKPEAVTEQYVASFFNDTEWITVIALTDRLIPEDEMGPGAVSEGVPIYIDEQLEFPNRYGHLWYKQGPFAEAVPELGYQSPLVPRETWRL